MYGILGWLMRSLRVRVFQKIKSNFDFRIVLKVYFNFVVKSKSKFILKILGKYFMKSKSKLI
jgi:hypothetical protein